MSSKTIALGHFHFRETVAGATPLPTRLLGLLTLLGRELRRFLESDPAMPVVAFVRRRS
jgi:hypothetical protein